MWRRIAGAVAAGLVAGLAVASLQAPAYRARATLIVAPALDRADPALTTLTRTAVSLVRSRTVARNVADALGLQGSESSVLKRIGAHARPGTAVVDVTATGSSAVDAERLAQQVVVVFQAVANARLGRQGGGAAISVWDAPGSGAARLGKPYPPWGVGGASLGLLAAVGLSLGGRRRAGGPPAEEQVPAPEPAPGTALEPAPAVPGRRGLIAELARRAATERDPARRSELAAYVAQFEAFADGEGNLPPNFLALVEDVFGRV